MRLALLTMFLPVGLCLALLRPHHLRGASAPLLITRRSAFARTRALAAVDDAPPPTAPAADLFAGMQEPISVDSPEGAEALRRMNEELTQAETDGAPASPPTAPAADVFAGMQSPISVDSPEGAAPCRRQDRYDMAGQRGPSIWLAEAPGARGSLRHDQALNASLWRAAGLSPLALDI